MIEILEELGVQVVGQSGDEIQAYCPVHHLAKGHEQSRPKWYINADKGAWVCFTCGQRGSLLSLVEALGGDKETIHHLRMQASISRLHRMGSVEHEYEEGDEEDGTRIDDASFNSNPRPPVRVMDLKDVDPEVCDAYNARWDAKGKCWLLPIYSFGGPLLGWQEKSKGYFNNVPAGVNKSQSLYGWHTYYDGDLIVVESPLDAMRFATYGYSAVATYGSFLSKEQGAYLLEAMSPTSKIILSFDNDDAGDHAMRQAAQRLSNRQRRSFRFFRYPPDSRGYDPGELSVDDLHNGVERATSNHPVMKENKNGSKKESATSRRVVRRRGSERAVRRSQR